MQLGQDKRIIIIIVSVAVVLRVAMLAFGLLTAGSEYLLSFDDAKGYIEPAINLIEGRGYSVNYNGVLYPETGRTPGYPLLIAASLGLCKSFFPLIGLQIIIGGILPVLAYYLARRIFADRFAAMAVAVFFAIDPLVIALSTLLMSETIFMALFTAGFLLLIKASDGERLRWELIITSGLLLSYATLMRPVLFYTLPIFIIYFVLKSKKHFTWHKTAYGALILFVALSSFVAPWIVRNKKYAGIAQLTSLTGIVSYFYTGSSVLSIAEGKSFSDERQELRLKAKATGIMELREPKNNPYFKREALRIIREHPKESIMLAGLSIFHLFTHDGYLDTFLQTGILKSSPQSVPQITAIARGEFSQLFDVAKQFLHGPWLIFIFTRLLWIVISILAVVGLFSALRRKTTERPQILLAIAVSLMIVLATIPVALGMHGRLRIPLDIFIIPLAAIGYSAVLKTIGRKSGRQLAN